MGLRFGRRPRRVRIILSRADPPDASKRRYNHILHRHLMATPAATWAAGLAAARDALLERLADTLRWDDRFVAAWLIGGLGRSDRPPDALSDLNVVAVVAPPDQEAFCARPWITAGQTTPERLALLRRFGTPIVIHENHHNATPGGTMTYVVYDTGVELALYLVPQPKARRPLQSRLLFDKASIPLEEPPVPEPLDQRRAQATASVAFFWMMAGIAARHRLRGWDWQVNHVLDMLRAHVDNVRRLIAGEPRRFRRRPPVSLAVTAAVQAAAIRQRCEEMEELMPAVVRLGVESSAAGASPDSHTRRDYPPVHLCFRQNLDTANHASLSVPFGQPFAGRRAS